MAEMGGRDRHDDDIGASRITRPLSDRDGLSGDEIGGPRSAATGASRRSFRSTDAALTAHPPHNRRETINGGSA